MIKAIGSQTLIYFAATVLNRGLSLLLLPIYTRFLTPADYGILGVTGSITLYLGLVASFSLEYAVQLFYFQLEAAAYRRFLASLWVFLTVAPLVLVGLVSLAGSQFGRNLFPAVPWHPYLQIAVLTTYVGVFPAILLTLLRSKQWAFMSTLYTIFTALATAGFMLYFVVVRKQQALGSLRGQLFGGAVSTVVASLAILYYCKIWRRPGFDWPQLGIGLRLSLPYIPYVLCVWLLNISDRWILPRFVPLADVGIYSLAYTVGMIMIAVGQSLGSAFVPFYYQKIKDPAFRGELPRLAGIYCFVPTIASLSLSLLGPEFLRIATTPPFYPAARLIPLICLAYWIHIALYQLQIIVLEYHRRTHWLIWLTGPAAALNIGLNLILIPLIPKYGIYVAACSTVAGYGLMAMLGRWLARKVDPIPFPWMTIGTNALIAIVVFFGGIYWLTVPNLYVALAAKAAVLVATAVVMMLVCGIRLGKLVNLRERPA